MRISDWSSDVCSSDLIALRDGQARRVIADFAQARDHVAIDFDYLQLPEFFEQRHRQRAKAGTDFDDDLPRLRMDGANDACDRSEEHTSELQSLMRISYAVFCLKKKKRNNTTKKNSYDVVILNKYN